MGLSLGFRSEKKLSYVGLPAVLQRQNRGPFKLGSG
jgi:hypothetical protein